MTVTRAFSIIVCEVIHLMSIPSPSTISAVPTKFTRCSYYYVISAPLFVAVLILACTSTVVPIVTLQFEKIHHHPIKLF